MTTDAISALLRAQNDLLKAQDSIHLAWISANAGERVLLSAALDQISFAGKKLKDAMK